MKYELKYNDLFEFSEADNILTISGRAWKGLTVPNKKVLLTSEKEISNIAETLKNAPLQIDHSKNVRDTCGKVFESKQDGDSVLYRAKVHDAEIAQKIRDGLINQCSVSLSSEDIKENFTYNGEEGWTALTGVSVVEMSLVLKGAVVGNSVMPEFSFSIIGDDSVEFVEEFDYNKITDNLVELAYTELRTKYDALRGLYEEQLSQNAQLNDEAQKLHKAYEYLKTYGFELPEKYLSFSEEDIMLYGELMQDARNATKIIGKVPDGEDYTDPKLEAKSALKDLIFNRDPNKKSDIKTWKDFERKYGKDLSDFK